MSKKGTQTVGETVCWMKTDLHVQNLDPMQEISNGKQAHLPDPSPSSAINCKSPSKAIERAQICQLLNEIQNTSFYEDQLVHGGRRTYPERRAHYGSYPLRFLVQLLSKSSLTFIRRIEFCYIPRHMGCNIALAQYILSLLSSS